MGATLAGGTLNINADAALGTVAGGLTFSGNSTLQAASGFSLDPGRNITINSGATATVDTQQLQRGHPRPRDRFRRAGQGGGRHVDAFRQQLV